MTTTVAIKGMMDTHTHSEGYALPEHYSGSLQATNVFAAIALRLPLKQNRNIYIYIYISSHFILPSHPPTPCRTQPPAARSSPKPPPPRTHPEVPTATAHASTHTQRETTRTQEKTGRDCNHATPNQSECRSRQGHPATVSSQVPRRWRND